MPHKAEEDEDYRTAIGGQATLLKYYELLAKVRQLINESPSMAVLINNPAWLEIRTVVVDALEPFPAAKAALARRLGELEEASNGRGV